MNEGAGVDVEDFELGGGGDVMDLRVVAGGHFPARAFLGVVELRVTIAAVIVVAEDDVPRDLQRRSGVNFLEGFLPEVVVDGGDAVVVEVVAERNDEIGVGLLAGEAHLGGDLRLIGTAPAAPVADDGEVERGTPRFGGLEAAWHKTAGKSSLRGDEEGADEVAAGDGHTFYLEGKFLRRVARVLVALAATASSIRPEGFPQTPMAPTMSGPSLIGTPPMRKSDFSL